MSSEFPPGDGAVGLLRDIRLTHRTLSVKKNHSPHLSTKHEKT